MAMLCLAPVVHVVHRAAWLLLLAVSGASAAQTAAVADRDATRSLSPYFVVDGGEPGVETLPLASTQVDATINGVIADVRVTQTYRNTGAVPIEARYVFPVSTRAAVYALTMRIGERVVAAKIREKQAARREYDTAKREGRSATLLEQQRPNVFQMSVAHVMPGDEIVVELRYTETLVPTDAVYRFVFPTVVGPRYNGAPGRDSHAAEPWVAQPTLRAGRPAAAPFGLRLAFASPLPVQALSSPSHELAVRDLGSRNAQAELAASVAHADRDVVVEYRLAGAAIASGLLVHEGAEENFFLALIEPPARVPTAAIVPREYVFVLDVSGSMHGFPIETAKTLLRGLVANLRPTDTFNIIPFAGGHSLFAPASVPASDDNVAAAVRFINGQRGSGSTELLAALRRALAMPADADRARSFVVITDGYVTIEKEAMDLVRANLARANVFAFGIGSSVNRFLIEGLARAGGGGSFVVLDPKQAAVEADRFRRYIEAPVLTHVKLAFDGLDAYDVDPPQLPDLFAQRPIVVSGKFRGPATGRIDVAGQTATGDFRASLDVAAQHQRDAGSTRALPQLWARSRIATLGDYRRLADDADAVKAITELGLKYSLLTDYTSFIAVDRVVRNATGPLAGVDQPQPLPAGVPELAMGEVPSTPEPEFAALLALAGGLAWWMRRRGSRANPQGAA